MTFYSAPKNRPKKPIVKGPLVHEEITLPPSIHNILKEHNMRTGIPISTLVAIALDNELDQAEPFRYSCKCPNVPYVEYAYQNEAGKIFQFLQQHDGKGFDLETLVLLRRDIGIAERDRFLLALREISHVDSIVEWYTPTRMRGIPRGPDYMRLRACPLDAKELKATVRFKKPADINGIRPGETGDEHE
jgi:hypothetical protein